jgi:hypothetical protein
MRIDSAEARREASDGSLSDRSGRRPHGRLGSSLRGAVAAATGDAPGEDREGRLATSSRFEAWSSEAGESRYR